MDRRTFNQLLLAQLLSGTVTGCVTPPALKPSSASQKGRVLFALMVPGTKTTRLRSFDWDTYEYEDFFAPIEFAHSIVQDRNDPSVFYVMEVFGGGARVNLSTGAVVKFASGENGSMFNGHGAITQSGEFIACTEIMNTRGSVVTLRSTRDFGLAMVLPNECGSCHQVVTLPNSDLLVIGHMRSGAGNSHGGFTFYDVEKRKVASVVSIPRPILHLSAISATEAVGISVDKPTAPERSTKISNQASSHENLKVMTGDLRKKPAPLYHVSVSGDVKPIWNEDRQDVFQAIYGLTKNAGSMMITSHSALEAVVVWNGFEIERVIPVASPTALMVSKDASEFMVIEQNKVALYSMTSFEKIAHFTKWPVTVALTGQA
jgi:hypothetical protein